VVGAGTESANGGSAASQAVDADARRWRSRRGTAFAIRSAVVLLPFVSSFGAARLLGHFLPAPHGVGAKLAWWAVVVVGSSAALLGTGRLARRLLPLAALFRLALVFPDRAPSRYTLALRGGTVRQLAERVRDGEVLGDDASEAAQNLLRLVTAIGKHDRLTRGHSERVRAYAELIGEEMGLDEEDRDRLRWSALIHDVGKLRVRPEVLNKAGRPNDDEWEELRAHPAAAAELLEPLRPWLGDWLGAATEHHERFDGRGYPNQLRGHDISLAGRIVAVADAYDCMTSARSYKRPLPPHQARYELTRNSGTQFDPDAVRALLNISVGRLNKVGGPIAWLGGLPGARDAFTAVSAAGSATSAVAAATVALAAVVGSQIAPSSAAPGNSTTAAAGIVADATVAEPARPSTGAAARRAASATSPTTTDAARLDTISSPDGMLGGSAAVPTTVSVGATPTPGGASTTTSPVRGGAIPTTTVAGTSATTIPSSGSPTAPTTTVGDPSTPTSTTTTTAATTTTAPPPPVPVAHDDAASLSTLGGSVDVDVLANDLYVGVGDFAVLRLIGSAPGAQVIAGSPLPKIRYSDGILFAGATFTYEVCDVRNACSQAVVTITASLL
jgi:HD domain